MNEPGKHCPIPLPGGGDCWGERHVGAPFRICRDHWRELSIAVLRLEGLETKAGRCGTCNQLTIFGGRCLQCNPDPTRRSQLRAHRPVIDDTQVRPTRDDIVYYVRWSDRVKIGTSHNLRNRLGAIPHDEILAVEPGGRTLERRRHTQFKDDLIAGQREWFRFSDALRAHIESVRATHGTAFMKIRTHA